MAEYLYVYNGKRIAPSSGKLIGFGNLPAIAPKTMRFKFYDDFNPVTDLSDQSASGMTWTKVGFRTYDWTNTNAVWFLYRDPSGSRNTSVFNQYMYKNASSKWVYPMSQHEFDLIDSDLTGVTSVNRLFQGAARVHHCLLKNTSSVTDWTSCFYHSTECFLETINRLDMSGVTNASKIATMFGRATHLSGDITLDLPNATGLLSTSLISNSCFTSSGSLTLNIPNISGCSISGTTALIGIKKPSGSVKVPVTINCGNSITQWKNLFRGASGVSKVTVTGWNPNGVDCRLMFCESGLVEVELPLNAKITDIREMFSRCSSLEAAPTSIDISSCTLANSMFYNCTALTSVPLYATDSITNCSNMFSGCTAVESGALALYQQMSTQATPPTNYTGCFTNCGAGTTTGAAELAQIPTSWGGTMA